jgi:hypothetical protein
VTLEGLTTKKPCALAFESIMLWTALRENSIGYHIVIVENDALKRLGKFVYAVQILYSTAIALCKLSIIGFYNRVFSFRTPWFKWSCIIVIIGVVAWWAASVFVNVFACYPIQGYWDFQIDSVCNDPIKYYLGQGSANIITDGIIMALPLPMIWHLHISKLQKLALFAVFKVCISFTACHSAC